MPASPGADSIVRRINAEAVVLLGWGRAVLLQLAHPLVAAGVAEHSTYMAAPERRFARLRSTVQAMLALTFGVEDEVAGAARGINAIHDRVQGRLASGAGPFAAGAPYSAHDPPLLRWVHATLLDSLPLAYETFVAPLTREERDRYCAEGTAVAPLLGIPNGYLPASAAALEAYVEEMLAREIVVTDTARTLAREVVYPSTPLAARVAGRLLRLPTLGLLPQPLREAYGLPWSAGAEKALRLTARILRRILPLTPTLLRHWPAARRARRRERARIAAAS